MDDNDPSATSHSDGIDYSHLPGSKGSNSNQIRTFAETVRQESEIEMNTKSQGKSHNSKKSSRMSRGGKTDPFYLTSESYPSRVDNQHETCSVVNDSDDMKKGNYPQRPESHQNEGPSGCHGNRQQDTDKRCNEAAKSTGKGVKTGQIPSVSACSSKLKTQIKEEPVSKEYVQSEDYSKLRTGQKYPPYEKPLSLQRRLPLAVDFACTDSVEYLPTENYAPFNHYRRKFSSSCPPSYVCGICHKQFMYMRSLHRHTKVHKGERPYICSICQKDFIEINNLKVHMKIHTGDKPHECSECGKTFTLRGHLHAHIRTHTGERPHKCFICNKAFKESGYLKKHIRIHTGEKPFKCSMCDKSFTVTGSLKSHMKTHKLEYTHQCPTCCELFTSSEDLTHHVLNLHNDDEAHTSGEYNTLSGISDKSTNHDTKDLKCGPVTSKGFSESEKESEGCTRNDDPTEDSGMTSMRNAAFGEWWKLKGHGDSERQFECYECHITFDTILELKRHMATHTGEKSFSCALCHKTFTDEENFNAHMATHINL